MAEVIRQQRGVNGRRFLRVPFVTEIEYFYGTEASGIGRCGDLSRGGLCISLGRYLTPGRKVLMRVFSPMNPTEAAELKGRIAWCRPTEQPERFLAGVEVFHDALEVSEDLSRLMLEAVLAHSGAVERVIHWRPDGRIGGAVGRPPHNERTNNIRGDLSWVSSHAHATS